ncbi:S-layer homology domain-containing protein [Paenibacillus sp. HB172176]|uniref:S-layer homology domain-containing protein n=1 Tax=Paenibacillus sp. HB172176 TaxID=2493690 RepID=UPI003211F3E7
MGLRKAGEGAGFMDAAPEAWYAGWLDAAREAELVFGYVDGSIRPNQTVSREEMSVMLARALAFAGFDASEAGVEASRATEFVDGESISPWAKQQASELAALGILNGMSDGGFDPQGEMTRAQAAVAVTRLLEVLGFL